MNHGEIVSFLWGIADLMRDTFRRGHYQDVILPLTVLRRLDCVLAPKKEKVLQRQAELRGRGLEDLDAQLRRASGFAFYNTGIATYVWVVTNRKAPARKGKVQLVDATSFWVPMRRSLGDKRREIPLDKAQDIVKILREFRDGGTSNVAKDGKEDEVVVSRVFPTTQFGFRKITVERPLRLNFQANPERIARLEDEKSFQALAQSKKRDAAAAKDEAEGRALQEAIRQALRGLPSRLIKDRDEFERMLDGALKKDGLKLPAPARKAILSALSALSERDETAAICHNKDGNPEPDPELRDTESAPLAESVEAFFDREVKPHVPDAWIDTAKRDPKDREVGLVGYEINFNRYFYPTRRPARSKRSWPTSAASR